VGMYALWVIAERGASEVGVTLVGIFYEHDWECGAKGRMEPGDNNYHT
jgi:hypothetical protein